jgi:thiamine-monophosphate kinase
MNEFSLIENFFKKQALVRDDVIFGIGDDAACLQIPENYHLLVSTDTLVAEVHFLSEWDAYDIAWKAVMVNVSDMAAMAATPCWISLALTLPEYNEPWLAQFSEGLHKALKVFNISLIGGDMTRGSLSMTLTIHGLTPKGQAIRRKGASVGDVIWVTGELGAAALAVEFLHNSDIASEDMSILMDKLQHPKPRVDVIDLLRDYASAAIDISDGLSADLYHICEASGVGACLSLADIPIHPLVKKYKKEQAIDFSLIGGDDYELCFTSKATNQSQIANALAASGLYCYPIGIIEKEPGLRTQDSQGNIASFMPRGYSHF